MIFGNKMASTKTQDLRVTCKGGNARFTMVPLKALSDQV